MLEDWRAAALAALARGAVAKVSILAVAGSTPREACTHMLVTADEIIGTIGGGNLEFQAVAQARAVLGHPRGTWRVQDYPLGPLLGQCCGGRVRLLVEHLDDHDTAWLRAPAPPGARLVSQFESGRISRHVAPPGESTPLTAQGPSPVAGTQIIEPLTPPAYPVLLFGAGHVGQAISRACVGLPLALSWFDSRPELAGQPGLAILPEPELLAQAARAPASSAVLILTHDHGLDYRLAAAALGGAAGFVGMIGSKTKRARFASRLTAAGGAAARLVCPIGLPGINGKEPAVIAIAVAAQLLMLADTPAPAPNTPQRCQQHC